MANNFVETAIRYYFIFIQDFLMNRKLKKTAVISNVTAPKCEMT